MMLGIILTYVLIFIILGIAFRQKDKNDETKDKSVREVVDNKY